MKAVIGIIAAIIIIGGGALVLNGKDSKTDGGSAAVKTVTSNNGTANQAPAANTITYTNSGFEPANLSVQSGSKVTIKNASSQALQFDSDPHPDHTDDPELNVGFIAAGDSATIIVTKKGSHGYHNHLVASDTGTLVVE